MLRRRGRRRHGGWFPAFVIVAVGILICMTYLSAEVVLVLISLLLIALGLWLLFFC